MALSFAYRLSKVEDLKLLLRTPAVYVVGYFNLDLELLVAKVVIYAAC